MRLAQSAFLIALPALTFVACASSSPRAPRELASTTPDARTAPPAPNARNTTARNVTDAPPEPGALSSPLGAEAPEALDTDDACNEQPPQDFLIRSHFIHKEGASPEDAARRSQLHRDAIEYRTKRYGYVAGFGQRAWNRYDPAYYSGATTFFDIKVVMNRRVIPALHCVERAIRRTCSASPYVPRVLDGVRFRNTFHNGEVTNHAYGIAIDIDPDRNSCCGCIPPLNSWPRCKRPVATPYERASIPKCWVDTFSKYGFYWLGNDPMEDTMHFEFLGDPDKILKKPKRL
jgi:hypothetical protein